VDSAHAASTGEVRSVQGAAASVPGMSAGRVPLFCDTALAGRIERAEAGLVARCSQAARRRAGSAGFVIWVAGGVASFAEGGSPYNKVAGLGFGGVPDPAALGDVEKAFAAHGSAVQVELAELADPAITALLAGRGYRLESFENVLGRLLTGALEPVMPPGIEVRLSGEEESGAWLDAVAEGSVHPDDQGVPWHEEFPREVIIAAERDSAAAGTVRYAAVRDGVIAGGATMRMTEGVAQLTGAATVPAHRRRGVQSALLSARLADATAAGCDVAVLTAQPGSKSHQNAQRQGFDLLYARAVLIRQPEPSRG
jgi:GNAT superfamily N-acetyltransferase